MNKRSKSIIQSKVYDSDFNNVQKEESKSEDKNLEEKVQDFAGYNFTNHKEEGDDEDDEEAGDGASSDFQPEEEKGGCLPVRSISGCIFGKYEMPDDLGEAFKKPTGLFGTKSFP